VLRIFVVNAGLGVSVKSPAIRFGNNRMLGHVPDKHNGATMFVPNDQYNPQWGMQHPFSGTTTARRIAFVLTESCDLLGVGAIAEALDCACALATGDVSARYEMQFLSASGGFIKCDGSMIVATDELASTRDMRFTSVFVAGGPLAHEVRNTLPHAPWLQQMRTNGTPVRFLAADGEKARADAAAWLPKSTDIIAAAQAPRGQTPRLGSAMRAAFEVMCADFGETIAREALRRTAFVGSKDLIEPSVDRAVTTEDRIRAAARWLQENCHRSICVADAADACAMSQRTLLRYFQTYLGTSPSEYLQRVRLERACELLAQTSLPADKVARRVGLSGGDRLGKLFRRCIGKSPTEYRASRRSEMDGRVPAAMPAFASFAPLQVDLCEEAR
jgi:transcriptional regulator GlxA family with amidase domain